MIVPTYFPIAIKDVNEILHSFPLEKFCEFIFAYQMQLTCCKKTTTLITVKST